MGIVASGDGSLYYEVHGSGQPVVLLRGLGRTVKHWLGYEQQLAKHARVITIELRGMGLSNQRYRWRDDLFANADDVIKVLDHLQIDKAHVAGISLGGMVALAAGLKFPERVQSLIVMNTSIAGQRTLRLSPKGVLVLSQIVRYRDERFHAALVDVLVSPSSDPAHKSELSKAYAEIAEMHGFGAVTVIKQLLGAGRFLVKRRLKKLSIPTLVVYGSDDQFVPNINSQKLAKLLPMAEVIEIEGAGHEIPADKPDELTAVISDWVGKNSLV
ncbi:MAG: alpha/beta hydrolase [Deltaproteobacteria bacterium]|nr:alpha/beta hydrolase [Deltaproteobacteria bacterium]